MLAVGDPGPIKSLTSKSPHLEFFQLPIQPQTVVSCTDKADDSWATAGTVDAENKRSKEGEEKEISTKRKKKHEALLPADSDYPVDRGREGRPTDRKCWGQFRRTLGVGSDGTQSRFGRGSRLHY